MAWRGLKDWSEELQNNLLYTKFRLILFITKTEILYECVLILYIIYIKLQWHLYFKQIPSSSEFWYMYPWTLHFQSILLGSKFSCNNPLPDLDESGFSLLRDHVDIGTQHDEQLHSAPQALKQVRRIVKINCWQIVIQRFNFIVLWKRSDSSCHYTLSYLINSRRGFKLLACYTHS